MNVWRGVQEVRMRFRCGTVLLLCLGTVANWRRFRETLWRLRGAGGASAFPD